MEEIKKNIILLGDGAVGKTSLIRRFVLDQFNDNYITTIGTKVTKKELNIESGGVQYRMTLMVWDVVGQKDYGLTQALSMRNIEGALLVSDLTRPETLDSLQGYWIPKIIVTRGHIPTIFLGNKADLESERQFDLDDINRVAEQGRAFDGGISKAFMTSAKTGDNIDEAFEFMARTIIDNLDNNPRPEGLEDNEINNLANIIDMIIADFSDLYGGIEPATPIVKHQMALSGLDPKEPDRIALEKFINRIADIEARLLKPHDVSERKARRVQLMNSID